MDFGTLLHVAQKNSLEVKKSEGSKYYSTKYEAPKKESKDKKLSSNIQKFLLKQQEEEREKKLMEKKKLEELLASRDTKAKNKIRKMLKVTKSANKSVLEDAVDNDDTAYTLQGPEQPDEDDYGYVSQEASQLYKKLMDKYKSTPEEKRFCESRPQSKTDLIGTKDRVRAAIMKEREEENGPHRRKRHSHQPEASGSVDKLPTQPTVVRKRHNLYDADAERKEEEQRKREAQRQKNKSRPPPPTLDFHEILRLAELKQHEPLEIEVEVKKKEPERLLTKKEKRELDERNAFFAERDKRKQAQANAVRMSATGRNAKISDVTSSEPRKMEPNGRIPKLNGNTTLAPITKPSTSTKDPVTKSALKPNDRPVAPALSKGVYEFKKPYEAKGQNDSRKHSASSSSRPSGNSASKSAPAVTARPNKATPPTQMSSNKSSQSAIEKKSQPSAMREFPPKDVVRKTQIDSRPQPTHSAKNKTAAAIPPSSSSAAKSRPPIDGKTRPLSTTDIKPRPFPPTDVKTRQFPPADIKSRPYPPIDPKIRQFPPADVRGRPAGTVDRGRPYPQQDDMRRMNGPKRPVKRHIIEDDDSEYDSEMDDFIDDGPDGEDYSQHIKDIFGYDKSRYKHIDEDVDNMESTFAQQMKEEFHSKRIGLMEDLEDMRLEAAEKKRAKKRRRLDDDDDED